MIVCDTFARFKEKFFPLQSNYLSAGVNTIILFAEIHGDRLGKRRKNNFAIYNWKQAMQLGEKVEDMVIGNRAKN